MKRNDAEQIGKLIQQFLRQESLESPLNEQRLLDAWPEILGPTELIPAIFISVIRLCMCISLLRLFGRS